MITPQTRICELQRLGGWAYTVDMKQIILSIAAIILTAGSSIGQSGLEKFTVLPGWRDADGHQIAALEMQLAPDWMTYWRFPGDSGLPTLIDWSGSQNINHIEIIWPRPEVFEKDGLRSIGYKGNVVLPIKITPINRDNPIDLKANISMGVCAEICIAEEVQIHETIPASGTRIPKIMAALLDQPTQVQGGAPTCKSEIKDGSYFIDLKWKTDKIDGPEYLIAEPDNPNIWFTMGQTERRGEWLFVRAELGHIDGGPISIDRAKLRSTVIGAGQAITQIGCERG